MKIAEMTSPTERSIGPSQEMCSTPDHTKKWRRISPVVKPQLAAGHITEGDVVHLDVGMNINVKNVRALIAQQNVVSN